MSLSLGYYEKCCKSTPSSACRAPAAPSCRRMHVPHGPLLSIHSGGLPPFRTPPSLFGPRSQLCWRCVPSTPHAFPEPPASLRALPMPTCICFPQPVRGKASLRPLCVLTERPHPSLPCTTVTCVCADLPTRGHPCSRGAGIKSALPLHRSMLRPALHRGLSEVIAKPS